MLWRRFLRVAGPHHAIVLFNTVLSFVCRSAGEQTRLRVLKHAEQYRLLGIVQRCSAHTVEYARPTPSAADVATVAKCLNTSPSIARTILDQARRARSLLIRCNMRLCGSLARKYVRNGGVDFYTLLSEACAGLSEAIDRFDRSRDMRFTTYATHWALRNVRRCMVDESRGGGVQLPAHIHYKLAKLLKIKSDIVANASRSDQIAFETDPEALTEAIAEEADLPVHEVRSTLVSGLPALDLDKPVFEDSSAGENVDYLVHSNEVLVLRIASHLVSVRCEERLFRAHACLQTAAVCVSQSINLKVTLAHRRQ